jgi:hypothetical protein
MSDTWWYRTHLTPHVAPGGTWWLELPRCLRRGSRLWIGGAEIDLTSIWPLADLMPTHIPAPVSLPVGKPIEVTLLTNFFSGHRDPKGNGHDPMLIDAPPRLLTNRADLEWIVDARYEKGWIIMNSTQGRSWNIPYNLLSP